MHTLMHPLPDQEKWCCLRRHGFKSRSCSSRIASDRRFTSPSFTLILLHTSHCARIRAWLASMPNAPVVSTTGGPPTVAVDAGAALPSAHDGLNPSPLSLPFFAPHLASILVYADAGASPTCVQYTLASLAAVGFPAPAAAAVTAAALVARLRGGANSSFSFPPPRLVVFPGGADTPMVTALGTSGAAALSAYVAAGGAYLGLCAGAYLAAARIEWEAARPGWAVVADRPLGWYRGVAVGSVLPDFDYGSGGAGLVGVAWTGGLQDGMGEAPTGPLRLFCQGGGTFFEEAGEACSPAAAAAALPPIQPLRQPPSVTVLASYTDAAVAHTVAALVGGGDGRRAPAAVRVSVGGGFAVLTGVHPELPAALPAGAAGETPADRAGRLWFFASLLREVGVAGAPLLLPGAPTPSMVPDFVGNDKAVRERSVEASCANSADSGGDTRWQMERVERRPAVMVSAVARVAGDGIQRDVRDERQATDARRWITG